LKTLAVVTTFENTSTVYRKTLESLFADYLRVDTFQVGNDRLVEGLDADVFVISSNTLIGYVKKRLVRDAIIIAAQKTLTREGFEKIDRLPEGTEGLLVNVTEETTYETLTLIYGLWGSKYDLEPYYPGIPAYRKKSIALTPAESASVPACVDRILD
jgi:sigma-54 dependent transcriptional regulator, acetoin dehydrogenase operon transcriptional activator AcoR